MPRGIRAFKPKTEFRKAAPLECQFEIEGEVRTIGLLMTRQSYNELSRSERSDAIAAILGGIKTLDGEDFMAAAKRECGFWNLMYLIPEVIHSATSHLPGGERPTLEQIASAISTDNSDYYNEAFSLLLVGEKPDEEENPTTAGKPAKSSAVSSISTGPEPSPKLESSGVLPNVNLPN